MHATIEAACRRALGRATTLQSMAPASGGCIHACYRVQADGVGLFIKMNATRFDDAFASEADGLAALREVGTRAPEPLAQGKTDAHAFLVLELLALGSTGSAEALGRQLAAQHRAESGRFGWRRDNYIGATPQSNAWADDWVTFWCERRLAPQLALAEAGGHGRALRGDMERLMAGLGAFFRTYSPAPSLLHGDLWAAMPATSRTARPSCSIRRSTAAIARPTWR